MWVRHLGLGRDVQILEVDGDQLRVAAGALTLRISRSDIAGAAGGAKRAEVPRPPQNAADRLKAVSAGTVEGDEGRCDVRGTRVDDAVRQVEGFLDRLTREGKRTALVVHGHGTGALKTALRDYFGASPYVEQFRPGDRHEGGDGATVITLRN
jgi:DNA mismatch repair protein MutS2